ncbi:hypothetical protein KCP78_22070 [Salmonella enterica subsp. enterica]|nr:hypothetical protein KCP78_22070 [Salmonella enterica subsp. enterica]
MLVPNISLATLLVIAEVAKRQESNLPSARPPWYPAQIAITARRFLRPWCMSSVMEGHGISYIHLLSVVDSSTLLAVLVMSFPSRDAVQLQTS